MLEWIKNKIIKKRNEDLNDFRSHILNEPFSESPNEPFRENKATEEPFTPMGNERFDRNVLKEPMDFEPSGSHAHDKDSYEVIDRLNFIENQLSAIKSQVELINERLKNMEARSGRRY